MAVVVEMIEIGKNNGEEEEDKDSIKEGQDLLGSTTFKELESSRFKSVEIGHELPTHTRNSYSPSKHCRLGLINAAIVHNKPPLNMFSQDPHSREDAEKIRLHTVSEAGDLDSLEEMVDGSDAESFEDKPSTSP